MNSWPKPFIPVLVDHDFPPLKIIDSSAGLINFAKSEEFRMYVCGITPYDATHLGHAATYLAFDLIYRYQFLSGKNVKFVENITDVDDIYQYTDKLKATLLAYIGDKSTSGESAPANDTENT